MTQELTRREALSTTAATIGGLLAGCSSDEEGETETETDGVNRTLDGETPNWVEPEETEANPDIVSEDSVFVEEGETVAVGNSEELYIFTVTEVENSSYAKIQVHNDVTVDAIEQEQFGLLAYDLEAEDVVGPSEKAPEKPKGVKIGNLPETYDICSHEEGELDVGESQTLTVSGTDYTIENIPNDNEGDLRINNRSGDFEEGKYEGKISGEEIEVEMKEGSNSTMKFEYGPEC